MGCVANTASKKLIQNANLGNTRLCKQRKGSVKLNHTVCSGLLEAREDNNKHLCDKEEEDVASAVKKEITNVGCADRIGPGVRLP